MAWPWAVSFLKLCTCQCTCKWFFLRLTSFSCAFTHRSCRLWMWTGKRRVRLVATGLMWNTEARSDRLWRAVVHKRTRRAVRLPRHVRRWTDHCRQPVRHRQTKVVASARWPHRRSLPQNWYWRWRLHLTHWRLGQTSVPPRPYHCLSYSQ